MRVLIVLVFVALWGCPAAPDPEPKPARPALGRPNQSGGIHAGR